MLIVCQIRTIFYLLAITTSLILVEFLSLPEPIILYIKWNIKELKQELYSKIYGQDEAINNLLSIVSESDRNNTTNELVILLGGPGVGRSSVIEILQNHIDCIYKFQLEDKEMCLDKNRQPNLLYSSNMCLIKKPKQKNTLCYRSLDFISTSAILDHHDELLNFLLKYSTICNTLYPFKSTCFSILSWNIISLEHLDKFKTYKEYENFIDTYAKELNEYLSKYIFKVKYHIVIFKPLKLHHVKWCYKDQLANFFVFYNTNNMKDFIASGCRIM